MDDDVINGEGVQRVMTTDDEGVQNALKFDDVIYGRTQGNGTIATNWQQTQPETDVYSKINKAAMSIASAAAAFQY
jgi:hypothetical protein